MGIHYLFQGLASTKLKIMEGATHFIEQWRLEGEGNNLDTFQTKPCYLGCLHNILQTSINLNIKTTAVFFIKPKSIVQEPEDKEDECLCSDAACPCWGFKWGTL